MKLLSVRAARQRITDLLTPVKTETILVTGALGRVLSADILSVDLPRFDNSSVDGFALIASDLAGAGPKQPRRLQVVADVPAGRYSRTVLQHGEAARIMTGAPVPPGATAVIMLEDTDWRPVRAGAAAPDWISASRQLTPGSNIRRRGSDTRRGKPLLRSGHRLRAQDLGLLAMLGLHTVRVFRKPSIGLFSSGDELVPPGRQLPPAGIRDTNSVTLASLLREHGCEVIELGIARDSRASIRSLLDKAISRRADLILTSAGVSVGALDLVREVVQERGQLLFWRVNVRPGKPLAVGRYRGTPFMGLPGNPVSAFVGFELFVKPAIHRLAGETPSAPHRIQAVLDQSIQSDGRESYLRAVIVEKSGVYRARLTGHQGSGNLLSLVEANALLMIPAGVKSLAAGDRVDAWWL